MKNIFLLSILLPAFSFAQDAATPATENLSIQKNEIGVNFLSVNVFDLWGIERGKPQVSAEINMATSICYKRHFGKNAVRFEVGYYVKPYEQAIEGDFYSYHANGVIRNFGLSSGFQHEFLDGRVRPFVFTDAFFEYKRRSGTELSYGCFGPNGPVSVNEENYRYGLTVGGGLKVLITKNISATLELDGRGYLSVIHDLINRYDYGYLQADFNPVSRLGVALSF